MLAAEGVPEWATYLGVPVWIGGLGLLLWLWLSGRVFTKATCDDRVAAAVAECDVERQGWGRERAALQARLDAVVADRDAWRATAKEEAEARQAAEKAAAALMESTNISLALLSALKDALQGRPER